MGIWTAAERKKWSTWKDTPTTPVNKGPTTEDRLKAIEGKWAAFAKQTRQFEERDRQNAAGHIASLDAAQAARAMTRGGGPLPDFERRQELFDRISRPYSFDRAGTLSSQISRVGNAFKTGW